jgi:hypothetical protein
VSYAFAKHAIDLFLQASRKTVPDDPAPACQVLVLILLGEEVVASYGPIDMFRPGKRSQTDTNDQTRAEAKV